MQGDADIMRGAVLPVVSDHTSPAPLRPGALATTAFQHAAAAAPHAAADDRRHPLIHIDAKVPRGGTTARRAPTRTARPNAGRVLRIKGRTMTPVQMGPALSRDCEAHVVTKPPESISAGKSKYSPAVCALRGRRPETKEKKMSQMLVLRQGYYECPECHSVFKLEDPDPENDDGVCDRCTDLDERPIRLVYLGPDRPANCRA